MDKLMKSNCHLLRLIPGKNSSLLKSSINPYFMSALRL
ncbi:MAG: hypothetical protein ACI91V_000829 [Lentimonas sp.]